MSAPVWSWQADKSQITGEGVSARVREEITLGRFEHSLIRGRHFDVMSQPIAGTLAKQFSSALAQSDNGNAAGLEFSGEQMQGA